MSNFNYWLESHSLLSIRNVLIKIGFHSLEDLQDVNLDEIEYFKTLLLPYIKTGEINIAHINTLVQYAWPLNHWLCLNFITNDERTFMIESLLANNVTTLADVVAKSEILANAAKKAGKNVFAVRKACRNALAEPIKEEVNSQSPMQLQPPHIIMNDNQGSMNPSLFSFHPNMNNQIPLQPLMNNQQPLQPLMNNQLQQSLMNNQNNQGSLMGPQPSLMNNNSFLQPFSFDNFNSNLPFQNMMLPNNLPNFYSGPFMPNTPPIMQNNISNNGLHESSLFTPNMHPFLNVNTQFGNINGNNEKLENPQNTVAPSPTIKSLPIATEIIKSPTLASKPAPSIPVASIATVPTQTSIASTISSAPAKVVPAATTKTTSVLNSTASTSVSDKSGNWPTVSNANPTVVSKEVHVPVKEVVEVKTDAKDVKSESKDVGPTVSTAVDAPIVYRYAWCPSTVGKGGVCYNETCQLAHEEKYARCCAPSCIDKEISKGHCGSDHRYDESICEVCPMCGAPKHDKGDTGREMCSLVGSKFKITPCVHEGKGQECQFGLSCLYAHKTTKQELLYCTFCNTIGHLFARCASECIRCGSCGSYGHSRHNKQVCSKPNQTEWVATGISGKSRVWVQIPSNNTKVIKSK